MANNKPRFDRETVRELVQQGQSVPQIANRLGCTERTVSRIKSELGISERRPSTARRMNEELRGRIQAMLDDGCPWSEISSTLGVTYQTIRRHFPGTQWTPTQRGQQGVLVKRFGRIAA